MHPGSDWDFTDPGALWKLLQKAVQSFQNSHTSLADMRGACSKIVLQQKFYPNYLVLRSWEAVIVTEIEIN